MNRLRRAAMALAPLGFGTLALINARAAPQSIPMSVLKQCAEINEPSKRLSCYDQVAERSPASGAALPKDPPAAKGSPAASAPAAAATSAATTAPPPKESFGLYTAEHPTAPRVEALITAKVISMGISSSGRSTVALEGDQVWELDSADPVLKNGDAVTVKRGTLGSFILTTPAGRLHRVHRIR
jgi:hypothetical protein